MIYLDNAATTKPCKNYIDEAQSYLAERFYNPSAKYSASIEVSADLERMRSNVLRRSGFNGFCLEFCSCGTEADNQALFTFVRHGNVVTTQGEHAAIYACCKQLEQKGVEVRYAKLNRDGSVNIESLLSLIDLKTSIVSVIHVNNETGALNDVNEIARLVKEKCKNCVVHCDGVQAFGKIAFKPNKYIDLYSVSAHKINAVRGCGALFFRKGLHVNAYVFGGGQEGGLRSGTENTFAIKAFDCAVEDKFANIEANRLHVSRLHAQLMSGLSDIVTPIAPQSFSPYILTVSAAGLRGEVLLRLLDERGVCVGTGSACSSKHRFSRVILACGYNENFADGIIRFSFSPQTTADEVAKAVNIFNECVEELYNRMNK